MNKFPDYEAALRKHRESHSPLISGAQCDDELAAIKILVDAALGDTLLYIRRAHPAARESYLPIWPKENNDGIL